MTKAELVEEVSRVSDLTEEALRGDRRHRVREHHRSAQARPRRSRLRASAASGAQARAPQGPQSEDRRQVDVPPKRVPYFKPGKELKDLINKDSGEAAERPISDLGSSRSR
jgi:integration host factor subunit beta